MKLIRKMAITVLLYNLSLWLMVGFITLDFSIQDWTIWQESYNGESIRMAYLFFMVFVLIAVLKSHSETNKTTK